MACIQDGLSRVGESGAGIDRERRSHRQLDTRAQRVYHYFSDVLKGIIHFLLIRGFDQPLTLSMINFEWLKTPS